MSLNIFSHLVFFSSLSRNVNKNRGNVDEAVFLKIRPNDVQSLFTFWGEKYFFSIICNVQIYAGCRYIRQRYVCISSTFFLCSITEYLWHIIWLENWMNSTSE